MKRELKILTQGEIKSLDVNTFFEYLKNVEARGNESAVFKDLAYIYRAVLLRANAISEIPWSILKGRREWKKWPPALTDLFFTLECDLCVYGAGYTRIISNGNEVADLQRLSPSTMRIERDEKGIKYFEFNAGSTKEKFNPKEIIYIRLYHPIEDVLPGISPTQVALDAANLGINANKFADAFFQHGAIPGIIFEVEGTVDEAEKRRATEAWDRMFGGIVNKFKTAILGQGMKANVIGAPPKDVAMPELMGEVRKQVAVAFGIPLDMLSQESANFATAVTHAKTFWTHTVVPEAKRIEDAFNQQFFYTLGGYLRFDTESTIIMSEDEAARADAVHSLVKSGLPLKTALATLGYTIPPGLDVGPTAVPIMISGREPQEFKADLKLWQKKALRRLAETETAFCTFYTTTIPWQVSLDVMEGLGKAETPEDVKKVFESLA